MIFNDSFCQDSFSKEDGGCIFMTDSSTGIMVNSLFRNNSASNGGSITTDLNASCSIFNSNFLLNYAEYAGGAIFFSTSVIFYSINNVSCIQNTALTGGSIYSIGNVRISHSIFQNNSASLSGGVYFYSSNIVVNF
jgi:hypothetical protein